MMVGVLSVFFGDRTTIRLLQRSHSWEEIAAGAATMMTLIILALHHSGSRNSPKSSYSEVSVGIFLVSLLLELKQLVGENGGRPADDSPRSRQS
jgi:hypothetical protein